MAYEPTNWENGKTPINETNLNKIEQGIKANSDAVGEHAKKISALTPVNKLTSTSTTAPLSANQGKVLNDKVTALTPVNNLTSTSTTAPLSANQGKVLNDKIGLKLLWTNPSTSTAYADGGSVSLDLSDYKAVAVRFRATTTSSSYSTLQFLDVGGGTSSAFFVSKASVISTRLFKATTTKVSFEEGRVGGEKSDASMIPSAIYGVR